MSNGMGVCTSCQTQRLVALLTVNDSRNSGSMEGLLASRSRRSRYQNSKDCIEDRDGSPRFSVESWGVDKCVRNRCIQQEDSPPGAGVNVGRSRWYSLASCAPRVKAGVNDHDDER